MVAAVSSTAAFAASAGGAGTAGAIDLQLNGDIAALGDFSTALFAQSTGANGLGGNITATLAAGNQLVGGENGVAVYFDGGAAEPFHQLRHRGARCPARRGSRSAAARVATPSTTTAPSMGNVDLGTGANAFANNVDATFYSGTTVNLGDSSNVLRNDGVIAPGAERARRAHAPRGQLSCSRRRARRTWKSTSRCATAIASRRRGTANVGGTINLSLLNTQNIRPGLSFQPLYIAAGGAHASGMRSIRRIDRHRLPAAQPERERARRRNTTWISRPEGLTAIAWRSANT